MLFEKSNKQKIRSWLGKTGSVHRIMKLYDSALSPFARKCKIIIQAKDLDVEIVDAAKAGVNGYAAGSNPLGKVPCLERGGSEVALFDSPLICEYLDSLKDPWLPKDGEGRWKAYRMHRIGDGLSEAVYNRRYEVVRDENLHWNEMIERHDTAIKSVVIYLDQIIAYVPDRWSFGSVAVICALDYADFRADHIGWRELAPKLAAWHKGFTSLPEYKSTNAY